MRWIRLALFGAAVISGVTEWRLATTQSRAGAGRGNPDLGTMTMKGWLISSSVPSTRPMPPAPRRYRPEHQRLAGGLVQSANRDRDALFHWRILRPSHIFRSGPIRPGR